MSLKRATRELEFARCVDEIALGVLSIAVCTRSALPAGILRFSRVSYLRSVFFANIGWKSEIMMVVADSSCRFCRPLVRSMMVFGVAPVSQVWCHFRGTHSRSFLLVHAGIWRWRTTVFNRCLLERRGRSGGTCLADVRWYEVDAMRGDFLCSVRKNSKDVCIL